MELADLCFHLRHRRRMYLPDDRFATAVAFVEGFNTALAGAPLDGFQAYVAARLRRPGSSLHWSSLIASTKLPVILERPFGVDEIPAELDAELTDLLVDLLETFQAGGQPPAGSA